MPYVYLTFAQLRAMLIGRLQPDGSGYVYWSIPELNSILAEAVRWWNATTASYKLKVSFNTVPQQPYYDLTTSPNPSPSVGAAMGYNATDVQVATDILYALLETNPLLLTAGSGQFLLSQVQTAIQNRLNRFLGDTGCIVTQYTIAGPSSPADTVPLPDTTLDVRRAAWVTPLPTPPALPTPTSQLWRDDEMGIDSFLPNGVQNPGTPLVYTTFGNPPAQIRLAPPPLSSGTIDLILVLSGPQINLSLTLPVLLGVPDDLSWALKWGALADLLNADGPSRDPARADYCEQRYQEAVQLGRILPSVIAADLANVGSTIDVGSVFDLDYFMPSWQAQQGTPSYIGMAGRNLACLGTTPDIGPYGIGLRLIANMPNPLVSGDGAYVQVSRDQIDPILDYAQHIACFKMAGAEFGATTGRYQSAVMAAKNQNGRLGAIAFYKENLLEPARESEEDEPRMKAVK